MAGICRLRTRPIDDLTASQSNSVKGCREMEWKLELVIVPVADVDRAKAVLQRAGRLQRRPRHAHQRSVAGGAIDPAGLGLLDRHRRRHDRDGARRDQGLAARRLRRRRRPRASSSRGVWRPARCAISRMATGSMGRAGAGTRSSSSPIPTAIAGRCKSAPPARGRRGAWSRRLRRRGRCRHRPYIACRPTPDDPAADDDSR